MTATCAIQHEPGQRSPSAQGLPTVVLGLMALMFAVNALRHVEHPPERARGGVSASPAVSEAALSADLPDLAAIESVSERKARFFGFLRPIVNAENQRIRAQRERLLDILADVRAGGALDSSRRQWLQRMADRYQVDAGTPAEQARRLRRKIDVIPPSLALAQAALESAWGTSRFARQGNNLFGEWCFRPGCGIVPNQRPEQASYEVEAFPDVRNSVRSYLHNLNSHDAYKALRDLRAQARAQGRMPTGSELAAGLSSYAAIGERYVEHIRTVIHKNDLQAPASG